MIQDKKLKVVIKLVTAAIVSLSLIALGFTLADVPGDSETTTNPLQPTGASTVGTRFEAKRIETMEELKEIIRASRRYYQTLSSLPLPLLLRPTVMLTRTITVLESTASKQYYSATNVQVAGIDEADMVKTDGSYIYVSRGGEVIIINARKPRSLALASVIEIGASVAGLYVYKDKLVVISSEGKHGSTTILKVYDVTDRRKPDLIYSSSISGRYLSSRLSKGVVYLIATLPAVRGDEIVVPKLNGEQIRVSEIIYVGGPAESYTILLALDLETLEDNTEALLSSYASRIYMSPDSLYLVYPVVGAAKLRKLDPLDVYGEFLPEDITRLIEQVMNSSLSDSTKYSIATSVLSDYMSRLDENEKRSIAQAVREKLEDLVVGEPLEETRVIRFLVDGLNVRLVANATLPGRVLDQFAMDETNNTFRIALTQNKITSVYVDGNNPVYFWPNVRSETALYVLSKGNLSVVSSLEGLAPGERMYAARYLGDKVFLVTFRRVDPLFAIDLSDPRNPVVVGEVKIPGYSEYLHPYGDLLLGVGVDATAEGRPLGLKISLFDISNMSEVKELDSIRIAGARSEVFYDHHAFLEGPNGSFYMPVAGGKVGDYLLVGMVDPVKRRLIKLCETVLPGVRRAVYINDTLYAISNNEIAALDPRSCSVLTSLVFERSAASSLSWFKLLGYAYRIVGDKLEIKLETLLPNPCYEVSELGASLEGRTIILSVSVLKPASGVLCPQVVKEEELIFRLDHPGRGSYDVLLSLTVMEQDREPKRLKIVIGKVELSG